MHRSYKAELDYKYKLLMSLGSVSVVNQTNTVIIQAIEELDKIQENIKTQKQPYNLKQL